MIKVQKKGTHLNITKTEYSCATANFNLKRENVKAYHIKNIKRIISRNMIIEILFRAKRQSKKSKQILIQKSKKSVLFPMT